MAKVFLDYVVFNEKFLPLVDQYEVEEVINGEPVKRVVTSEPITAKKVILDSTFFASQQERKNSDESAKISLLRVDVHLNKSPYIDLSAEDIVLIKSCVKENSKFCGISSQVLTVLDGENLWDKIDPMGPYATPVQSIGSPVIDAKVVEAH